MELECGGGEVRDEEGEQGGGQGGGAGSGVRETWTLCQHHHERDQCSVPVH